MFFFVAKIFLCGNKYDLKSRIQVTDADMEGFCEQCRNLVSGVYKTSCKTGEGVNGGKHHQDNTNVVLDH